MFIDLVTELGSEPYSHTRLALTGEDYPIRTGDATLIALTAAANGLKRHEIDKLLPKASRRVREASGASGDLLSVTDEERQAAIDEMLDLWGISKDRQEAD